VTTKVPSLPLAHTTFALAGLTAIRALVVPLFCNVIDGSSGLLTEAEGGVPGDGSELSEQASVIAAAAAVAARAMETERFIYSLFVED
jgi:hypothetical protein